MAQATKTILMIGAGKSATYAIDYFLKHASTNNWQLVLADANLSMAQQKLKNSAYGKAVMLDINKPKARAALIKNADVVVSMMPPAFHILVIKDCIAFKKHFINASYITPEIKALQNAIDEAGIIVCGEMGLDPGIDHMSAMKTIDELKAKGATITSFKSFCGGLVAPESDNNLWHYKISWNPRNVALAGQGTAQCLQNGALSYIPYNRLFTQTQSIEIKPYGKFEAYANRDSISYMDTYQLPQVKTFLRGTLRKAPFCTAWNVLVQIGLTDDSFIMNHLNNMTYSDWLSSFLDHKNSNIVWVNKLNDYISGKPPLKEDTKILTALTQLGIFGHEVISIETGSPAAVLQTLMERQWAMQATDKDMIVMQHEFKYTLLKKNYLLKSSLVLIGESNTYTAMAKTVSLPLAIATKMILQNKFKKKGILIPTHNWLYNPILKELKNYKIDFVEEEKQLSK
jgi:saccharopine dehydrogenase-like NADP-dependent oxidoreductase